MLVIDPSEHYLICRNAVMTGLAELGRAELLENNNSVKER